MRHPAFSARRRTLLGALPLLAAATPAISRAAAPTRQRLVLAGPFASVSNPLVRLAGSGALADVAQNVEFLTWSNPDQLRALAMEGKADFVAMPSNVAANLYNRGVPLQLLNVSVWGILWLVSRDGERRQLADFKGEEIAMPFRADMPDIVFQLLAEKQGLSPRNDFRLRYVASPVDALQLLMAGEVKHALLSEPVVSMALRRAQAQGGQVLHRSLDLQAEWGRLYGGAPRIPQAGIVALGEVRKDAALLGRFQQAHDEAYRWCAAEPDACGKAVASAIPALNAMAVADALRHAPAHVESAAQARGSLEHFYQLLLDKQPALVGGKLPDAAFYGGSAG